MSRRGARIVPLAAGQIQIADWLPLAARQHVIHALLELDITATRRAIRRRRALTGEPLSFTGFVIACLARAIAEDRMFHAMRKGRRDLVLFDDVDVAVAVEQTVDGDRLPVPSIVRAAHRKDATRISREIREIGRAEPPYALARKALPVWLRVPALFRRMVLRSMLADPWRRRRLTGTTFVTAVGMFGHGTAWGVPQGTHYTLGITLGGIDRKPRVVRVDGEECVEPRETLALTLSFDHDIIDGAPAARFARRLGDLIEAGPPEAPAPVSVDRSVPA